MLLKCIMVVVWRAGVSVVCRVCGRLLSLDEEIYRICDRCCDGFDDKDQTGIDFK